jgi:hypothetical protein
MPKNDVGKNTENKTESRNIAHTTYESTSYLQGLFTEFKEQTQKYNSLTGQLLSLEARIELAEKTLCLTRDHFAMTIAKTQDSVPNDWSKVLNTVRFVGVRLADACAKSLQEHKKLTPEQLLRDLNDGMFRFRTNSPLREIHAALLRHPYVKRNGAGAYIWVAPPAEKQLPMRLRVVQRELVTPVVTKQVEEETTKFSAGS